MSRLPRYALHVLRLPYKAKEAVGGVAELSHVDGRRQVFSVGTSNIGGKFES